MSGLASHVGSSASSDDGLDAGGGIKSVGVPWARKSARISFIAIRASAKVVARGIGVTSISAVKRIGASTLPDVVLNQELSTVTGVDTIGHVEVVVVVDMSGTEAEGRTTRVEVLPEVVVNSDGKSYILRAVAVRVADEHGLPVIVEVAPGDGHVG